MGWSAKHGLRPNRTRPLRDAKGRPLLDQFGRRLARPEPCREVGVLTRTIVEVYVDRHGWHRATWSRDYTLHPTKGFRVASPVRATFEDDFDDWSQGTGIYITETFTRSQTKR